MRDVNGGTASSTPAQRTRAALYEAYGHESFWPIYEAAKDTGCFLAIHGGAVTGHGLQRLHRLIVARTLSHVSSLMLQLTSVVFGSVFDLFPGVHVGYFRTNRVGREKPRLRRSVVG
jgi:hypothetical protein